MITFSKEIELFFNELRRYITILPPIEAEKTYIYWSTVIEPNQEIIREIFANTCEALNPKTIAILCRDAGDPDIYANIDILSFNDTNKNKNLYIDSRYFQTDREFNQPVIGSKTHPLKIKMRNPNYRSVSVSIIISGYKACEELLGR